MSRSRTVVALALVLVGIVAVVAGCALIAWPLGLVALGSALAAAGLLVDVSRRP